MSYLDMPLLSAIIGGTIGIIGTILAVYLVKKRKRVAYEVASVSLMDVSDAIRDKIKIEYENKPVKNLYAFQVQIKNTGNAVVEKLPILFEFDPNTKILDVGIETTPEREFHIEKIDVNKEGETKYEIDFLNRNDQISLFFLTANNKSEYLKLYAHAKELKFYETHIVSIKELLMEILHSLTPI